MPDERALLIAIPLRHLEAALAARSSERASIVLPAGGPGALDVAAPGTPVLVMPTDSDDTEVSAATWRATYVRRVPHRSGTPWPDGLPTSWTDEHPAAVAASSGDAPPSVADEDDEDDRDHDEEVGPQSFLEVVELGPLPRQEWLFANELVGKQVRGGRYFRPRVPTLVDLPE